MSAPKPGDRVIYTGTRQDKSWPDRARGNWIVTGGNSNARVVHQVDGDDWWIAADKHLRVVERASYEMEPNPVYVNHDTTEMQPGDVARVAYGNAEGTTVIYDGRQWHYSTGHEASHPQAGESLTLLVRDGQVVT